MSIFRKNINQLGNVIKNLLIEERVIDSISQKLIYFCEKKNIHSIVLTGNSSGRLIKYCNQSCIIKGKSAAWIVEAHIFILHHLCKVIDDKF